jgi:hypothetical protein
MPLPPARLAELAASLQLLDSSILPFGNNRRE